MVSGDPYTEERKLLNPMTCFGQGPRLGELETDQDTHNLLCFYFVRVWECRLMRRFGPRS